MANPILLGILLALGLTAPKHPDTQHSNRCYAARVDVDSYLFEKYLATPKIDRTGDFTSKDPKAAEFLGMTLRQYAIGGVDKKFKLTLYVAFKAMDAAGLNPGITAAFRDDYRQQLITKGIKAHGGNSYHGGSLRGGYQHGLAVDIVSLNGNTHAEQEAQSEKLWQWVDKFGRQFGIGRPYGDHDAPHVAPVTSAEFDLHRTRIARAHKHKGHVRIAKHQPHMHKRYAAHKNTKAAS